MEEEKSGAWVVFWWALGLALLALALWGLHLFAWALMAEPHAR